MSSRRIPTPSAPPSTRWRKRRRRRASSTTRSSSASWTRHWPGEQARSPDPRAALPELPHRAGALLEPLPELQSSARVARYATRDWSRVRAFRVDRVRHLLVLLLVRARHPGRGLERRTAQGAEGIQVSRPVRLGLRRWRHVPDALLSLVRPDADVALRSLPERLPAL